MVYWGSLKDSFISYREEQEKPQEVIAPHSTIAGNERTLKQLILERSTILVVRENLETLLQDVTQELPKQCRDTQLKNITMSRNMMKPTTFQVQVSVSHSKASGNP